MFKLLRGIMIEAYYNKSNPLYLQINLLSNVIKEDALRFETIVENYTRYKSKIHLFVKLTEETTLIEKSYLDEITRLDKRFQENYIDVSVCGLFGIQNVFYEKLKEESQAPYKQLLFETIDECYFYHKLKASDFKQLHLT